MPIYVGCKNINNYLENAIILEGNILKDISVVVEIIKNPELYYKKGYTEKNIKNVNLIQNLPNIF
jgi:hypothetical protein